MLSVFIQMYTKRCKLQEILNWTYYLIYRGRLFLLGCLWPWISCYCTSQLLLSFFQWILYWSSHGLNSIIMSPIHTLKKDRLHNSWNMIIIKDGNTSLNVNNTLSQKFKQKFISICKGLWMVPFLQQLLVWKVKLRQRVKIPAKFVSITFTLIKHLWMKLQGRLGALALSGS